MNPPFSFPYQQLPGAWTEGECGCVDKAIVAAKARERGALSQQT